MTNLTFSFSPRVRSAWEWRRFLADYKNQPTANSISDHANMTVSYVTDAKCRNTARQPCDLSHCT